MSSRGPLADFAERVTGRHRRAVIVAVLAFSLVLGSGAAAVDLSTSLEEFRGGTPEAAADDYVRANMSGVAPNATQALVVVRDDENLLTREDYLRHLRAQRAMRRNETVNRTLHPDQRPLAMANVVAIIALHRERNVPVAEVSVEPRPPLDEQIAATERLSSFEARLFTTFALTVLNDVDHTWPEGGSYAFLPTRYDPDENVANATTMVVSHREEASPRRLAHAQTAMRAVVNDELDDSEATVVGDGVVDAELRQSSLDSLLLVGPVAALFVLFVLLVAYRDPLDVALGLFGVGLVLLWTFGYMGWAGVTFNQLFVAVPVFLTGLSIDYGIHVVMRYREEREARNASNGDDESGAAPERVVRSSMAVALAGVGAALVLVTATTATGFLSNLTSGVAPIREFAVVSAVGIVSALAVFGTLVPALKVELDSWLARGGGDRNRRAFGTRGPLRAGLAVSVGAARTAPWAVVGLAVLATLAGAYGATTLGTDFEEDDLLVDDTPDWAERLPEPFRPGEYTAQATLDAVERNGFVYQGTLTEILVRGDVTRPDTLERVANATDRANRSGVVLVVRRGSLIDPTDAPGTRNALMTMHEVADDNESFNRTLHAADTDGDGVPDRNLERVYDEFYAAAPRGAPTMLHRADGEYRALRIVVPVNGANTEREITREVRRAAAPVQGDGLRAIATGDPIQNQAVAAQLLDTVVESLAVTLAVVLVVLVGAYYRSDGVPTLGAVTLLPVLFAVAWILGTMALLGIPFNVMTALITSFTIGLGVDYTIHVSERYVQELARRETVEEALRRSVLGTGGALLGSAATTAGGFGVLAFALLAPLQQFGVVTGLTIVYAFLGSVVVLPSLLVVWTRHAGFEPATEKD